jgi:hypothetical protein
MPLNLTRSPPESLLAVLLALDPTLDLISLLLQLVVPPRQLIPLIEQLPQLRQQHRIGQKQSTVFMVVLEVSVLVHRVRHAKPLVIN